MMTTNQTIDKASAECTELNTSIEEVLLVVCDLCQNDLLDTREVKKTGVNLKLLSNSFLQAVELTDHEHSILEMTCIKHCSVRTGKIRLLLFCLVCCCHNVVLVLAMYYVVTSIVTITTHISQSKQVIAQILTTPRPLRVLVFIGAMKFGRRTTNNFIKISREKKKKKAGRWGPSILVSPNSESIYEAIHATTSP